MTASCDNCALCSGGYCSISRKGVLYKSPCGNYQPDPEYVASLRAKHEEEMWRKKEAAEEKREKERRSYEESLRQQEEERRKKEERRRRYEEVNGEPYLPIGVRAAMGIAAHFFKK